MNKKKEKRRKRVSVRGGEEGRPGGKHCVCRVIGCVGVYAMMDMLRSLEM